MTAEPLDEADPPLRPLLDPLPLSIPLEPEETIAGTGISILNTRLNSQYWYLLTVTEPAWYVTGHVQHCTGLIQI